MNSDTMEELEKIDQPRGVVAAANRYASSIVDLTAVVQAAKSNPKLGAKIVVAAQVVYRSKFDAFIAGVQWGIAHPNGEDPAPPEETPPHV